VLALVGAGPVEYLVGGARLVFGVTSTVVIADAHDDPHASGVRNSKTFELIDCGARRVHGPAVSTT